MKKIIFALVILLSPFLALSQVQPAYVGTAPTNKLGNANLAWISTWTAGKTPLTISDVNTMIVHSVDQFNLEVFPQTSTTYTLLNTRFLSNSTITACYLTPASVYATKIPKPTLSINNPGKNPTVTVTYTWPTALVQEIKENNSAAKPKPIYFRVQLACQRR